MDLVNITQKLSNEVIKLITTDFPPNVFHKAKLCLMDYLGATFAGSHFLKAKLTSYLEFTSSYSPNSGISAIGFANISASLESAVLVNGISAHSTEMDDGSKFGMIHPGSPIISALIPLAKVHKLDGKKLLLGIIVGYEIAIRVAYSIQPSHYNRGFHPSSTCGSIGVAAGAAAMLDFSIDEIESAIVAAAISSGGTLKVVSNGSQMKPLNVGQASLTGLISAITARSGFKPPDDGLAGENGFFQMMSNDFSPRILLEADESCYWIEQVYFKPHAACRHAHPTIDACLKYRGGEEILSSDIKYIEVYTYGGLIGRHDSSVVRDLESAKMSIPFSAAMAIILGSVRVSDFNKHTLENEEIIELAKKTKVIEDPNLTKLLPYQRKARVLFHNSQNEVSEINIDCARGDPLNNLSEKECREKFTDLLNYSGRSKEYAQEMIHSIMSLPNGLEELFARL